MGAMDDYLNEPAQEKHSGGSAMDAYLNETPAPAAKESSLPDLRNIAYPMRAVYEKLFSSPAANKAALEHGANAAALGYLPQLAGAARSVMPDPSSGVNADLAAKGFKINEPKFNDYMSGRDDMLESLRQGAQSNPIASGVGTGAGVLTGGAALSALAPARAASAMGRIGQAALEGTGIGAASNPGDEEGKVDPLQLEDRAKHAAVGGATSAVLGGAVEGLSAGAKALSDKLGGYALEKTLKAIGMTKRDYDNIPPEKQAEIAKFALQNKLVTPFSTTAKIAQRAEALKQTLGENVGNTIDEAQQTLNQMPPVGQMPVGQVQASPLKPTVGYGDTSSQPLPRDPSAMPYQDAPSIPVSEVTHGFEKTQPETVATLTAPRPAGSIDAPALAKSLSQSPELANLRKVPGAEGLVGRIDSMLDTLAKNPQDMDLKQAQGLRQGIDALINWSKRVPDMAGTQQYLAKVRNAVSDAMNESVDVASAQSGGQLGALRSANKDYSTVTKIGDIADNAANRAAANRAIGLTDTISGAGGAGTGAAIGGMAGGIHGAELGAMAGEAVGVGANKFARSFGPSLAATTANATSKALAGLPALSGLISKYPGASVALQNALRGNTDKDPLESSPVFQQLKANPAMIDQLSDPQLRDMLNKKLGRTPADQVPAPVKDAQDKYLQGN